MADRPRHPKKEVEKAVAYAESKAGGYACLATGDGYSVRTRVLANSAFSERREMPGTMQSKSSGRSIGAKEATTAMKTFEFSIIASGLDPSADDFESRFYDAGCDDALVAFQHGHIIVDFSREAASIDEAITSAVENVKTAGATVERIEPDPLVSQAEIAERTGLTRAAVNQYSKGARHEAFPPPVVRVSTTRPLWDWAVVAAWLYHHDRLPKDAVIEALAVKAANSSLTASHFGLALKEKLKAEEAEFGVA
jgi:hypothetical protein